MVITVVWMQSWISLVLAIGSLLVVVLFIFFCTCFDQKKHVSSYVIDENGIKKEDITSPCNLHLFRRYPQETENGLSSKNLLFYNFQNEPKSMNSTEVIKRNDTILTFHEYNFPLTCRDELRSCLSTESLNSFYSARPSISRTSRESFVSLISDFENEI